MDVIDFIISKHSLRWRHFTAKETTMLSWAVTGESRRRVSLVMDADECLNKAWKLTIEFGQVEVIVTLTPVGFAGDSMSESVKKKKVFRTEVEEEGIRRQLSFAVMVTGGWGHSWRKVQGQGRYFQNIEYILSKFDSNNPVEGMGEHESRRKKQQCLSGGKWGRI